MRRIAGRLADRKGQALAEFALIVPILFLLVAGIIEFGRAWNLKQAVTDAAREGARYAVVQDDDITSIADVQDRVKQRLSLSGIKITDPPTTVTVTPVDKFQQTGKDEMTVRVTTTYRMGWVGALLAWTGGTNTVTIASKATMRNEW